MRALALLALCLPATALAGTRFDKFAARVDDVALDGVVEVPLRAGVYGDELPYVAVTFDEEGKDAALFLLDLGSSAIVVTPGFADDHGDGAHTKNKAPCASLFLKEDKASYRLGGKVQLTKIPELRIGGLTLSGIRAQVAPLDSAPLLLQDPGVGTVSGVIGVGALGLAAAILPSQGVVRFAPAEQAEALLQQVGGTVVPWTSTESDTVKTWQGKQFVPARFATLQAELGGAPAIVSFSTADFSSRADRAVKLGQGPSQPISDFQLVWTQAGIAGQALGSAWVQQRDESIVPDPFGVQGALGYEFLRGFDLALDPAGRLALAPAKAQQRTWDVQGFIDRKAHEIEEVGAPPEDGEVVEKTDEDKKAEDEERAGLYAKKALFHVAAGQAEPAIAAAEQATALDADPCEHWKILGTAYLFAGRFDDAAAAAKKGLDRYQAWAALSMDEREEIEKLEDAEREASGVQPQDLDACFDLPAIGAYLQLVAGQYEQAGATWAANADLDPGLGVVGGVGYLLAGQADKAQGPLRHTLNRAAPSGFSAEGYVTSARIALAELYRSQGDLATAIGHWERERLFLAGDPFAVEQYAELLRAGPGEAAVLPALQALAAAYPENPVPQVVLASALAAAGQDAAAAWGQADRLLADLLAYRPNVADLHGVAAWYHFRRGQDAQARAEADKALALSPAEGYAHWTLMKLAEKEGKLPVALQQHKLARAYHMGHWVFASLPEPKAPVRMLKPIRLTEKAIEIEDKVFFETAKATILPESFELLDAIAKLLVEHPELLKVSVEGHTDSDGEDKANLELSQARAQAVVDYLAGKGVEAARLAAKGWGEQKPIGDNATDAGKEQNRRVEFAIVKKAK